MNRMTKTASVDAIPADLLEPSDRARFADVNVRPFNYRHRLHLGSIFTLDTVLDMAKRLPDGNAFKNWQNGDIPVEAGWVTPPGKHLSLEDTLAGLETNDSIAVFKHVEQDPEFGPILQDLLQEVFDHSSPEFQDEVLLGECLIFVNSPRRTTPYHFDLESSFLLQIQGEKTIYAWPCGDETLVPDSEVADYCGAGNLSAGIYKPERQADANVYSLLPGDGVHFPSLGPHWVQNGDAVSISINVNYDVRSLHRHLRYAHGVNHRLRQLGLNPAAPGRHPWVDSAKAKAWVAAREAKRGIRLALGKERNGESYPVWKPIRR